MLKLYIVISGNTGAGKSTLGRHLCKELNKKVPFEYIDERCFHHELVQQMFVCPSKYAFLIQMNFLLQRTLKIKNLFDNNRNFLIERSIEEDFLFAYRHYQLKDISSEEFVVYKNFWKECLNKVPPPSLYVCLRSSDACTLTKRIMEGYEKRTRSKELQDDNLQEYVSQMNRLYDKWFKKLKERKIITSVFETTDLENDENFKEIRNLVLSLVYGGKA